MIGIIASMDDELDYIKGNLTNLEKINLKTIKVYKGIYKGRDIILSKCLTGKVNMAICAQQIIDNFEVDLIINCGVAGGLKDVMIGDVVIAKDTLQHDMDAVGFGYELSVIPDLNIGKFVPCSNFVNASKNISLENISIHHGRIVTGDKFVHEKSDKDFLENEFNALCADMETAALAQVCYINNIKFAGIRGISDDSNKDSKGTLMENLKVASDNCGKVLLKILGDMN